MVTETHFCFLVLFLSFYGTIIDFSVTICKMKCERLLLTEFHRLPMLQCALEVSVNRDGISELKPSKIGCTTSIGTMFWQVAYFEH